jgi:serine protease AprX
MKGLIVLSATAGRVRAGVAALGVAAVAWAAAGPGLSPSSASSNGRLASAVSATVDPALHGLTGSVNVVVQGARSAESAVTGMGGRITHDLPLIGGFSATVPARQIDRIARLPGVTSITDDAKMKVMTASPTMGESGPRPADVYQQVVHANDLRAAGDTGRDVTVALIDTGVTPMADTSSRLVSVTPDSQGADPANCVNFTGDGTCNDEYGHGTFIAGLIAGTGAASDGQYSGVAPNAKILSVKIAGADGFADVSTVIAAIQWVVAFKTTYNIKVLNLSLGTDGAQTYQLSPLDFAVEKAWQSGIVTVVAASNLGPGSSTIDKPADDPFVITVGAVDDNGTTSLSDDNVPPWSARGPTAADGLAKPDVVAPGVGLVSLAAPGASITTQFPPAMAAPYRQGSGTSMSTAIVSGLVADILSADPGWSPDRVKFALTSTASPDASSDPMAVGAGVVNGYAALSAPAGLANQGIPASTGHGSLRADQGNGSSWYGSSWYGSSWYGLWQ